MKKMDDIFDPLDSKSKRCYDSLLYYYNIMIEADDTIKVVKSVAENLMGVAMNKSNFERLPDSYWGYFARGHDNKGKFGVIIAYSENSDDVIQLIEMYQQWAIKYKTKK
ncbi:MAG TPA: hypothetical protein VHJ38_15475 [Nitrososphaeraceae archaeon]|jgi:hypothetical protein|nr:hypothetical protein [Nitrososphaeraceae archaeon]